MTRGVVLLAQNNSLHDYVKMAYALSLSLKISQNCDISVSLITNDKVPKKYLTVFDNIIPVPKDDSAINSSWKIENRSKIYQASPYEETIVLDTDMLVMCDISYYWDVFKDYDIYFTSKVFTYRGELITNDHYRRVFTNNNLSNLYTGLHYFKKSSKAEEFYNWMDFIINNWQEFYGSCFLRSCPKSPSMDVIAALTAKVLGCDKHVTNHKDTVSFVHMKPMLQGWKIPPDNWTDILDSSINDLGHLKVGNYRQDRIFHYTEKNFLNDDIVNQLEKLWKS